MVIDQEYGYFHIYFDTFFSTWYLFKIRRVKPRTVEPVFFVVWCLEFCIFLIKVISCLVWVLILFMIIAVLIFIWGFSLFFCCLPLHESLPYCGGGVWNPKDPTGYAVRGLLPPGRVSHAKLVLGKGPGKDSDNPFECKSKQIVTLLRIRLPRLHPGARETWARPPVSSTAGRGQVQCVLGDSPGQRPWRTNT